MRRLVEAVPSIELQNAKPARQAIVRIETTDGRSLFHRTYEVRGMVLFQLKQPEKAIESFNKSIQLQPGQVGPYIARARARADVPLRRHQPVRPGYERLRARRHPP